MERRPGTKWISGFVWFWHVFVCMLKSNTILIPISVLRSLKSTRASSGSSGPSAPALRDHPDQSQFRMSSQVIPPRLTNRLYEISICLLFYPITYSEMIHWLRVAVWGAYEQWSLPQTLISLPGASGMTSGFGSLPGVMCVLLDLFTSWLGPKCLHGEGKHMLVHFTSGRWSHADLSDSGEGLSFCLLSGFLKTCAAPLTCRCSDWVILCPSFNLVFANLQFPGCSAGLGLGPPSPVLL